MATARARMAALRKSLQAGDGAPPRLIETHISWVLLAGTLAYKLKKPLKLAFLDFSTLALRRHYCREELRLNRRLAPLLYLDVVDVCDGPDGVQFGGGDDAGGAGGVGGAGGAGGTGGVGSVVDVALRMRRFPDGALWSEMAAAGSLAPHHIDALAQRLADFHRSAAVAPPGSAHGSAASHDRVTQGLIEAINARQSEIAAPTPPGPQSQPRPCIDWPALRTWLGQQQQALAPLWPLRLLAGRIRECHGDLHLANLLQLDGAATAFDGIEFDDAMRWTDVLYDIAFVAMDLLAIGRDTWPGQRGLAWRFINAYLSASGDYDGLPALRYFMVCRALVRARVAAIGEGQGLQTSSRCGADAYLALAAALSGSADARLAITHGLPGSGKSFVALAVSQEAGAINVRADVERKRLFGLHALQSSQGVVPGGIYTEASTQRSYARLGEVANLALESGWPVIVDAAFLLRHERAAFAALAAARHVPFTIFDCRADVPLLRQRIVRRHAAGADPSEADVAVLERLITAEEPLGDAELALAIVVDAALPVPPAALAQRWLAAVRGSA